MTCFRRWFVRIVLLLTIFSTMLAPSPARPVHARALHQTQPMAEYALPCTVSQQGNWATVRRAKGFTTDQQLLDDINTNGLSAPNHAGAIDLNDNPANRGPRPYGICDDRFIRAAKSGIVQSFKWEGEAGHVLRLRHADGNVTIYGHMPLNGNHVSIGQSVSEGQIIGIMGCTGTNCTGIHVHFATSNGIGNWKFKHPFPAPPVGQLIDPSFEHENAAGAWQHDGCNMVIYTDTSAQHGNRYLATNATNKPNCTSVHQDVQLPPQQQGQFYRLALWMRSPTGQPRNGRLALWGLGSVNKNAALAFSISQTGWQCVETGFQVTQNDVHHLRVQIYLDSTDAGDYLIDTVVLNQQQQRLCPLNPHQLLDNPSFEYGPQPTSWQHAEQCAVAAYENNGTPMAQQGNWHLGIRHTTTGHCASFSQELAYVPQVGETYRFSIWLRSAQPGNRSVRLALWGLGGENLPGVADAPLDQTWRCYETVLSITRNDHIRLKAEVYLLSPDIIDYQVDSARLARSVSPLCPQP